MGPAMKPVIHVLTLSVLVLAALAGCTAKTSTGTAGIAVTDAPSDDYSSVVVTFSKAAIHKADAGNESGWQTISNTTKNFDLVGLKKNNTVGNFGFGTVSAGRYTQIRIYVDNVVGTKKSDGSKVTMTVPSSVLKTSKSFEVKASGNTTLTLDFDLDKSINCNPNGCMFKPVLGKVEATEK